MQRPAFLGSVLTEIQDAVVATDGHCRITYINPAAERMYGVDASSAVGNLVSDLFAKKFVNPEDEDKLLTALENGGVWRGDKIHVTAIGEEMRVRVSIEVLTDDNGEVTGQLWVIKNLTSSLRDKERVTHILESIPDAFVSVDSDWRYTYVNASAERMLGRHRNSLLGKTAWDVFPCLQDSLPHQKCREAIAKGKAITFELFSPSNERWYEVSANPNANGLSIHFKDNTERKQEERHRLEFYKKTIFAATLGKLIITDPREIYKLTGPAAEIWKIRCPRDCSDTRVAATESVSNHFVDSYDTNRFVTCVGEALCNSIKYADEGIAALHVTKESVFFVVSDQGGGIPCLHLPEVALSPGFSTAGTLGMGFKIMIDYADRVYLATGPDGTTVALEFVPNTRDSAIQKSLLSEETAAVFRASPMIFRNDLADYSD